MRRHVGGFFGDPELTVANISSADVANISSAVANFSSALGETNGQNSLQ